MDGISIRILQIQIQRMFYLFYAVYGDFRVLFWASTIQFIENSEFALSTRIMTTQSFVPINNIESYFLYTYKN